MRFPDLSDQRLFEHTNLLCDSYLYWTGYQLVSPNNKNRLTRALFNAPFVLVSHGTERIPLFNYANRMALELFEMDWNTFLQTPSNHSADQDNQSARAELMARVKTEGCITDCSGIRVTASGKRFRIDGATVWNVTDSNDQYHGQAAMFDQWKYL